MDGKRMARWFTNLVVLLWVIPATARASGGSPMPPPSMPSTPRAPAQETPRKTAEEMAVDHYNAGLQYRDKALSFLKEASQAAKDKDRDKLDKKAEKEFGKAIDEYHEATRLNPRFHQAYSDLGFALRKTGNYAEALKAYDQALSLVAEYGPAIEYRGEAYLGLDRTDDAKQAYLQLFPKDRAHADELLAAMKGWVAKRQGDPGKLTPAMVQAFSAWVQEREDLAKQTPTVSELQTRKW